VAEIHVVGASRRRHGGSGFFIPLKTGSAFRFHSDNLTLHYTTDYNLHRNQMAAVEHLLSGITSIITGFINSILALIEGTFHIVQEIVFGIITLITSIVHGLVSLAWNLVHFVLSNVAILLLIGVSVFAYYAFVAPNQQVQSRRVGAKKKL